MSTKTLLLAALMSVAVIRGESVGMPPADPVPVWADPEVLIPPSEPPPIIYAPDVPEPAVCAVVVGLAVLGAAIWRRRRD